jgi:hypothetical protein
VIQLERCAAEVKQQLTDISSLLDSKHDHEEPGTVEFPGGTRQFNN